MSRDRATSVGLAAIVIAGYTTVAWAVGSFYPFSVFSMYAHGPETQRAGRLAARTRTGEVVEVTAFAAFECDAPIDPDHFDEACRLEGVYAPRYLDDELAFHVRSHEARVRDGEPIEIVRRIWTISPEGEIDESTDCVLAHCEASR